MADISNIRTLEELTNVVSQLYFNLNKLDALYYDMFINPIPLTLDLERYDENGELVTVQLNNRAKDRLQTLSGSGSPNGVVAATEGSFYIDNDDRSLYYKSAGVDKFNWVKIWTASNFQVSDDGSNLQNLNADNITSGVLPVPHGGTGNTSLTGIIKGNGTDPFTVARANVDYLAPTTLTGMVCYWPGIVSTIPAGWLLCNGQEISSKDYPALYSVIGTSYGSGDSEIDNGVTYYRFKVPNLMGKFIRSCVSATTNLKTESDGSIPSHSHAINKTITTTTSGSHSHSLTLKKQDTFNNMGTQTSVSSTYLLTAPNKTSDHNTSSSGSHTHNITISGNTNNFGTGSQVIAYNMQMFPIIKT